MECPPDIFQYLLTYDKNHKNRNLHKVCLITFAKIYKALLTIINVIVNWLSALWSNGWKTWFIPLNYS